ncbi:MAG: YiiX/YebB-like N1pC/P60 family cysteine hydrolase [Candidatus Freyarchaeota archaeon]|nr:YiiX/YebB-like N1pC/P60 family cysteine hydrolase [Candidatus Freyrarchaeum guaymaensis]
MRRTIALLTLTITVILLVAISILDPFSAPVTYDSFRVCSEADEDSVRRSLGETLQAGDIILARDDTVEDLLVSLRYSPYWTHAMIYVGGGMIVEGTVRGVVCSPVWYVLECEEFCVLRVNTYPHVRLAAAWFACTQVGKPCDGNCFLKQVYGCSYYCSELVWAAYKAAVTVAGIPCGPDIDGNPCWSPMSSWGVSSAEIFLDTDTYIVFWYKPQ